MPKNSVLDNYSCCEVHNTASYTVVLTASDTLVPLSGFSDGESCGFDISTDTIVFKRGKNKKFLFNGEANFSVDKLCNITFELWQNGVLVPGTSTMRSMEHAHWLPSDSSAGDVEWFFDWSVLHLNGAAETMTSLSVVGSVALNEKYYHKLSAFKNGTGYARLALPTGGWSIGDVIHFNLRRTPTGGNDTYGADALLIKVALHIPVNDFGSRQLYIK